MADETLDVNDQLAVAILQRGMKDIQEYRNSVNKTYMAYCAAMVSGKPPDTEWLCPKEKEEEKPKEDTTA